jgi:hypothetical protein
MMMKMTALDPHTLTHAARTLRNTFLDSTHLCVNAFVSQRQSLEHHGFLVTLRALFYQPATRRLSEAHCFNHALFQPLY